jgi:hypothetical protein
MPYRFLADSVVLFHFLFVGFVIFGGILVLRWRKAAFFHLPAAAWGVFIEWSGLLCPLTFLENYLRDKGGIAGYQGGFVDHYIMPVLYPDGLTRDTQFALGAVILLINVTLYVIAFTRHRRRPGETFRPLTDAYS